MAVDKNTFFREATIRICGSLDIKISLTRAFQYLRNYIPLNALGLHLYLPGSKALRSIAKVSASGAYVYDRLIPWPESPSIISGRTQIINTPERDPIRLLIQRGNPSAQSILLLKLEMENKVTGILSLRVNEKARYTE
jgi:hypothetical protein